MKKQPTSTTIKKLPHIVTKYNYIPDKGRTIATRSMTIQNDTPSLGKLVEKLIAGMPVRTQPGVYPGEGDMNHDEEDWQEVTRMDQTEKADVAAGIRAMTQRLKDLENEVRQEMAEKPDPSKQPGNADSPKP